MTKLLTLAVSLSASLVLAQAKTPVQPNGNVTVTGTPNVSVTNSPTVKLQGVDGGVAYTQPGLGHWDCARNPVGICTSTGPTNHGNMSFTAGSYLVGYCTAATYTGSATTNTDGGQLASCGSRDGGAIFNESCMLHPASGLFYRDFRDTTFNSIGCTSVSGTSVCAFSACVN
jgi:hypothetical protein